MWLFTLLTALREEKRLLHLSSPQQVLMSDLPRLLRAAHPSTGGCLWPGSALGVCRLR